jgi:mycothiol synthase
MTTSRPYSDLTDLRRLIQFVSDMRARNPTQRWHPGDVVWRMHYSHTFDPAASVQLWEDERGEVVGFGWRYPPDGADLNPRDPALLPDMIEWAQSGVPDGNVFTATQDVDKGENAVLEAQGFKPTPAYGYHLRRQLDDSPPHGKLPEGFTLRALAGDHEAAERAALHRTAFGTENVTNEGYRNVMHAPLYERDLDLVVVAPDGRLAAFCLCWLDTANGVGLFEPVGTHPDFQRQGQGQAVMLEGMRRMRARGMKVAVISSAAENVASLGLYTSLGFRVESKERVLRR